MTNKIFEKKMTHLASRCAAEVRHFDFDVLIVQMMMMT